MQQWKPSMVYRNIGWAKSQRKSFNLSSVLLMSISLCLAVSPALSVAPTKSQKAPVQTSKAIQTQKTAKKPEKIAQSSTKETTAKPKAATANPINLPTLDPVTDFIQSTDSEATAKMASPLKGQTPDSITSPKILETSAKVESSTPASSHPQNSASMKTWDPFQPVSLTPTEQKVQPETSATFNATQKDTATPATLNTNPKPASSPTPQTTSSTSNGGQPAASLPDKNKSVAKTEKSPKPDQPKQNQKETQHKPANKHEKKSHPLVIAPEPLLPAQNATAPKSAQTMNQRIENKPVSSSSGQVAKPIPEPAQLTGHATASTKSTPTSPPNNKPVMQPTSTSNNTQATINPSMNPSQEKKPLPAIAQKQPTTHSQATASVQTHSRVMERGFYPIGYTPAVKHLTPQKNVALRQALVHYNRGVYYARHKQWDEAITEYMSVINEDSNMADAYVGLSTAEMHLKDWENALQHSTKALQLKQGFVDPANITQARYNLSSVYCITNDYGKALHYFKQIKKAHHPETEVLWSFLQNNCQP